MHFVNFQRIPQVANIRFVVESATFFDLHYCFGFHGQIAETLYCSLSLQKHAILRNPSKNEWNPEPVVESMGK